MKGRRCVLMLLFGLAACNGEGTSVSVKGDSLGRELDTLGRRIEEKAAVVGDSVKAKLNDLKEAVDANLDSIKKDSKTH